MQHTLFHELSYYVFLYYVLRIIYYKVGIQILYDGDMI